MHEREKERERATVTARTTIIAILGKNKISKPVKDLEKIVALAFHKQSYDEVVTSIPGFSNLWASLSQKKRSIESCFELHANDLVNQTAGCLSLMMADFNQNKIDDARDYGDLTIITPEFAKWPEPIRKKFAAARSVMCEWRSHFLSYTNRNAGTTNREFRRLITNGLGRLPKQSELEGINLVAHTIAKYLRENNLTGFFDPIDIRCGDDIEGGILDYSRNCAAFIQLVEKCSFSRPPSNKKNWCHLEYQAFCEPSNTLGNRECQKKRTHFAITTEQTVDDLLPAVSIPDYHDWSEATTRRRYAILHKKTHLDVRSKITEIARDAYKSHQQLAECIIASLYE